MTSAMEPENEREVGAEANVGTDRWADGDGDEIISAHGHGHRETRDK